MSTTILEILMRSRGGDQAAGEIKKAGDAAEKAGKQAKKASEDGFEALRKKLQDGIVAAAVAAAGALASMTATIVDAVNVASHIEEMSSQFDTAFGEMADTVRTQLGDMAAEMNRSKFEFEEYASAFQLIFTPMGMTRAEASKLSVDLTGLTADLASFFDVAESDVLMNLKSALVGEQEAVRKYGIILNETTVKEELARMGKEDLTGAALEQAKVMARLNLIWAQTTDAQGDAARTAGSFANVMRGLQAALLDVRAGIGQEILPVLTPFMAALTDLIREVGPQVIGFFATLAERVAGWAESINLMGIIEEIIEFVTEWGLVLFTFGEILMGVEHRGKDFRDLFEYMPDHLEPFLLAIAEMLYGVREFVDFLRIALQPVRDWIAEHVSWGDVLIGLGSVIVRAVLPVLARFVSAWGPILLAITGAIAVVSLLRNAWESDWLGIRTAFQPMVDAIGRGFRYIVGIVRDVIADGHISKAEWGQLWEAFRTVTLYVLDRAWKGVQEMFGNIVAVVRDFFAPYWQQFTQMFPGTAHALTDTWAHLELAFRQLWEALKVLFAAVGNGWNTLVNGWQSATTALSDNTSQANFTVDRILRDIVRIIGWFAEMAIKGLTLVAQVLSGDWSGAWRTAEDIVRGTWAHLSFLFNEILAGSSALWRLASQTVREHWPEWSATLSDWGKAAWSWLVETAIPNTVAKLGEWWNALRRFVTERLPDWKAKLLDWAAAAWEWIRDTAVPNAVQWLGNLWTKFREWSRQNLPEWVFILLDWAAAAWTWIRDEAIPKASDFLTNLVDTITGFFDGPKFREWKERIERWWGVAQEFFTVTVPQWLAALGKKWEEVQGVIGGVIAYLTGLFEPLYTTITENLGPALSEVQAFLTGNETSWANTKALWEQFKLDFNDIWEDIKTNVLEPMRLWFEENLPHTYKVLADSLGDLKETWLDVIDAIKKSTEGGTDTIEKKGPTRWREIFDLELAILMNHLVSWADQLGLLIQMVTAIWNGDWEAMWDLNRRIVERGAMQTLTNMELSYKEQLALTGSHEADMTKLFEMIGRGIPVGFSKGVEDKIEEARRTTAKMADETLAEYGKRLLASQTVPSKVFKELGEMNVQGLIYGLGEQGKMNELRQQSKKLGETTLDAVGKELEVRSPSQKMFDIGLNVLRGLLNGITDNALVSRLMTEARALAQRILTTIRSALNIKSPSEETQAIGEFVVQGLMEGILAEASSLNGLMHSVGGSMMASLSSGLETGKSVVQTQLDSLRNLAQSGANSISSAFNEGLKFTIPAQQAIAVSASTSGTTKPASTDEDTTEPLPPLTGDQLRDVFGNPSGYTPGTPASDAITQDNAAKILREFLNIVSGLETNLNELIRLDNQVSSVEARVRDVVHDLLGQITQEFALVKEGAKSVVDVNKLAPMRDLILDEFNALIGQGGINQNIVGRFTERFREFVAKHLQEEIAPVQGPTIWDFVAQQWEKVGIDFNKEVLPLIKPGMNAFQVANIAMELLKQKGVNQTNPLSNGISNQFEIYLTPTGNDNQDIYNTIQTLRAAYGT